MALKDNFQKKSIIQIFIEFVFYGNYFYGFCIVALMYEATAQLNLHTKSSLVYLMAFFATVLFYNYPYARSYTSPSNNPRTHWHRHNHSIIVHNQILLTFILAGLVLWFIILHHHELENVSAQQWFLLLIFPIVGAMYYGLNFFSAKYNLRQIGWLKPFIIGFVWAGVANVYPEWYFDLVYSQDYSFSLLGNLLFLKNLMFVSLLAIMFDIKDYVSDSKYQINTLVVKLGLRKTIFYVLLPFTILGLLTFLAYAVTQQFSLLKMLAIMIPFFLLIAAARSFRKRRSLLYFFVVIDGLMIVKAILGILSMMV
jgi:1,4-dihydroxy-2-naphthoate octaprenyltransferase